MRKHWNEDEIKYLMNNYNREYKVLIKKLGRTYKAIVLKAHKLGIKRERDYSFLIKRNIENNPMKCKENVKKAVIKNNSNGTYKRASKRMKLNNPTKKGMSKIWKKNIGISSKKRWAEDTNYRHKMKGVLIIMREKAKSPESINKRKLKRQNQILPLRDTSIEVKIQNFLKELGIEFFTHQYIKIKHGYQCDILVPSMNLVIECDGDYWHGNKKLFRDEKLTERIIKQRDIDHIRTQELIVKGFRVIRIWENEIRVMDINDFEKKIIKLEDKDEKEAI